MGTKRLKGIACISVRQSSWSGAGCPGPATSGGRRDAEASAAGPDPGPLRCPRRYLIFAFRSASSSSLPKSRDTSSVSSTSACGGEPVSGEGPGEPPPPPPAPHRAARRRLYLLHPPPRPAGPALQPACQARRLPGPGRCFREKRPGCRLPGASSRRGRRGPALPCAAGAEARGSPSGRGGGRGGAAPRGWRAPAEPVLVPGPAGRPASSSRPRR